MFLLLVSPFYLSPSHSSLTCCLFASPFLCSFVNTGKVALTPLQMLTDECVEIFRALMQSEVSGWRRYLQQRVSTTLALLPEIVKAQTPQDQLTPEQTNHIYFAFAAFCAIGESNTVPSVGKKIDSPSGKATIVSNNGKKQLVFFLQVNFCLLFIFFSFLRG